ncbi:MAG: glycoside hydrolase family 19 protein [Rhizobium sp.]
MSIDRAFFFDHIREKFFPGGLRQSQIDGHAAILDAWEKHHAGEDDRWLAYLLATAYHESGHTLQPVRETLASSDAQAARILEEAWKAGRMRGVHDPYWRPDANGDRWFGRGLVQLTFRANYDTLGRAIGVDLVANPSLALTMPVAIAVIFFGMLNGSFTGHRLATYFNPTTADWVNARKIVNGLDRADAIAGYGKNYHAALRYGG